MRFFSFPLRFRIVLCSMLFFTTLARIASNIDEYLICKLKGQHQPETQMEVAADGGAEAANSHVAKRNDAAPIAAATHAVKTR